MIPNSDRPRILLEGPTDKRDLKIEFLEQELLRLKHRIEELERRPACPMPSYPVDCPHRGCYVVRVPSVDPRFDLNW